MLKYLHQPIVVTMILLSALLLPKGRSSLQRLVRKFTEKDSVKTDRLIELYSKYVHKVHCVVWDTSNILSRFLNGLILNYIVFAPSEGKCSWKSNERR